MTAFKAGDSRVRRGGRTTGLGVEFDVYWLSPDEMERRVADAGFATCVLGRTPRRGTGGFPAGISARPEVLKPAPSASVNSQPVSRAAPSVPALRFFARRASSAVTPAASSRGRCAADSLRGGRWPEQGR